QAIKGAISRMNPGDPLSYKAYLKSAYHVLVSSHAQIKHIILLGDGDVLDGGRYKTIASEIRRGGVTISTVITNAMTPMDSNAMRQIAKYGGGRFYQANNPQAVPKIFLREARTVARASVISGKFHPRQVTASDILSGIRTLPPLYGYVATTPKAAAQIILTSPKLDPILSAWQFGLGRTVAWTSDASGLWSRRWVVGKHANRFWANLVSLTFPARPGGLLSVSLRRSQETGTISASAPSSLGGDPRLMARLVGPDSAPQSIPLQLSSTGQFVGSFAASQRGTYFANVRGVGAGRSLSGTAGLSVSYSPEYRSLGTNMQLLRSVARAGGGSIVDQPGAAWRDNLAAAYSTNSLSPWLWLLAALLLPVDVALRRLVIWPGVRKLWSRAPKHE
ncbi:MAG: glutamine amidotransferase, partial [Chloroflexota bacterium]